MQSLRILFTIDRIAPGGTESQLLGLIARLDRRHFTPVLCTLRPSENVTMNIDCPHLELGVPRLVSPVGASGLYQLVRYIQRKRIDIVHTYFQDASLLGLIAAGIGGVPMRLVSFRDLGFWRTRSQNLALRSAYNLATGFVANSRAVKEHFCSLDGLDPERVKVIYNGIDSARFHFSKPR